MLRTMLSLPGVPLSPLRLRALCDANALCKLPPDGADDPYAGEIGSTCGGRGGGPARRDGAAAGTAIAMPDTFTAVADWPGEGRAAR